MHGYTSATGSPAMKTVSCGPGTLVMTIWWPRLDSASATRAPTAWKVDVANPGRLANLLAATAEPVSRWSFRAYETWCRRTTGLDSPTGKDSRCPRTFEPSDVGRPSSETTDIGTMARNAVLAVARSA